MINGELAELLMMAVVEEMNERFSYLVCLLVLNDFSMNKFFLEI